MGNECGGKPALVTMKVFIKPASHSRNRENPFRIIPSRSRRSKRNQGPRSLGGVGVVGVVVRSLNACDRFVPVQLLIDGKERGHEFRK
jgi:hypothetical protein